MTTMTSTSSNMKTLAAYNAGVLEYVKNTPASSSASSRIMLNWIDRSLDLLVPGVEILEIGSAIPRDAIYMRKRGFRVQCSDASSGLVKNLRRMGEETLFLNILEQGSGKKYPMIFANAVMSHFTPSELQLALANIYDSLEENGVFSFSFKKGIGEKWVSEKEMGERYVHYWSVDEMEEFVSNNGFSLIFTSSNTGDLPGHIWVNFIVKRLD